MNLTKGELAHRWSRTSATTTGMSMKRSGNTSLINYINGGVQMHKKLVKNMGIAAAVIAVSLAGAETSAYAANEIIGGEVMNPSVTSDKTEAEAKVKAAE